MRCCLAALGRELGLDEIDEVADAVHGTGTLQVQVVVSGGDKVVVTTKWW